MQSQEDVCPAESLDSPRPADFVDATLAEDGELAEETFQHLKESDPEAIESACDVNPTSERLPDTEQVHTAPAEILDTTWASAQELVSLASNPATNFDALPHPADISDVT